MRGSFVLACVALFAASPALAKGKGFALPDCLDREERVLDVNNEEVLRWKEETPNGYKDRALVTGTLVGVLLDRRSHIQLEVDLTPESDANGRRDHLEIIFSKDFGKVSDVRPGLEVTACGDYITANKRKGHFPPSPVDAILHWVHKSTNENRHPSGFMAINGVLYGNDDPGAWDGERLVDAFSFSFAD